MKICTALCAILLLCCASFGRSSDYEPRPSLLSRRAIDGSRGRKHFDPREDGFFDDYGYEKGQYHGKEEEEDVSDIRSNVPGEPGVDYPALLRIPRTSFSCYGRDRGYYADEETGCQVFHLCDEGHPTSFLCPVGSLFSQRLLTCDWWIKVSCSQSQQFYGLQSQNMDAAVAPSNDNRLPEYPVREPDQESERTAPVLVHANQLEQNQPPIHKDAHSRTQSRHRFYKDEHREKPIAPTVLTEDKPITDSPVIRINPIVSNDRRANRARNHTRLNSVKQEKFTPTEATSITGTSVKPTIAVTGKSRKLSAQSKNDSPAISTTARPLRVSVLAIVEENHSVEATASTPSQRREISINDFNTHTPVKNSISEYEDMEGKESIGLVKSHVERKLEKGDEQATTTPASTDKIGTTTLELLSDSATLDSATQVETTTSSQQHESIQAKESINLVHSKLQQKNQFNDIEKTLTIKSSPEESYKSLEDKIPTTHQILTDDATVLDETKDTSTETIIAAVSENRDVSTTLAPKKEGVRKMSGFIINVPEKPMNPTALSFDEISPSDYQKLLNSSDNMFTYTTSSTATSSLRHTTLTTDEIKRMSDSMEESNAPLEATLTINDDTQKFKNEGQASVGFHFLSQPVPHREKQSTDIKQSENIPLYQTNHDLVTDQNRFQTTNSMPRVRTYQNFRFFANPQSNQQTSKSQQITSTTSRTVPSRRVQYISSTTQVPYEEIVNTENIQVQNIPLRNSDNLFHQNKHLNTRKFENVPVTTQVSVQNYNGENQEYESERFKNYQLQFNEKKNFRNTKTNFVSTTSKSYLSDENKAVSNKKFQNQPEEPRKTNYNDKSNELRNSNNFQNQQNFPVSVRSRFIQRNNPDNFQNHYINYQTHRYPEKVSTIQPKTTLNSKSYSPNYNNYQTTPIYINEDSTEIIAEEKNTDKDNYEDYQNYDNADDVIDTTFFENFGTRLSSKQQDIKPVKSIRKEQKLKETTDAHVINSGLQGKIANFLYTMSQLAENDNAPRPFNRNRNEIRQNLDKQDNLNLHKDKSTNYNTRNQNQNNFNTLSRGPARNNAYNGNNFKQEETKVIDASTVTENPTTKQQSFVELNDFNTRNQNQNNNFNTFSRVPTRNNVYDGNNFKQEETKVIDASTVTENPTTKQQSFVEVNDFNIRNQNQNNNFNTFSRVPTRNNVYDGNNFKQEETKVIDASTVTENPTTKQQSFVEVNDFNTRNQNQNSNFNTLSQVPARNDAYNGNIFKQEETKVIDGNTVTENPTTKQKSFVEVDDFAAPKLETTTKSNYQAQHFDIYWNLRNVARYEEEPELDDSNDNKTLNEQKQGRILNNSNEPVVPKETVTTYSTPNAPAINVFNLAQNQQSVQVPQPNYNVYQIENSQVPVASRGKVQSTTLSSKEFVFHPKTEATLENSQVLNREEFVFKNTESSISSNAQQSFASPSNNVQNNVFQTNNKFNATNIPSTTRSIVETEVIPALSFDFNSDQGRMEYLDALEKGLVTRDTRTSETVENVSLKASETSRSNKSEKSSLMDNFKDTAELMKGTE